jgi:transposase
MLNPNSNQLTIPAELLGLNDIRVLTVNTDLKAKEIIIKVESTKQYIPCSHCGKPTISHGVGRPIRLRHLPIFGKRTYIEITPRRGLCKECDKGPTTTERLDWYAPNSKFTKAYEQHLLFELVNSTVADVSQKEEVDYHAVDNLIASYVEAEIDFSAINQLGVLGLDEISLKKGYRDFVTLITYRCNDEVNVLAVINGREKAKIAGFLQTIPKRLKRTIVAVCCDLYDGYINASKEVFKNKVPVVADRFHVRKLYRRSLVNLRKVELRCLRKTLTGDEYKTLKPAIALLRKQKDYFSEEEKQILKTLFELSPKLKLGYEFSRQLSGLFDSHITPEEAIEKLRAWMVEVMQSELTCFADFVKTLNKYEIEMSNYFSRRYNSGFVEGFNNKVKVLKRRCYGLSNATKLFQRLIIDTVGLARFAPSVIAF